MYDAVHQGGRVTPEMIADAIDLETDNYLDKGWAFERLWQKYDDMVAYRIYSDKIPGNQNWGEYIQIRTYIPSMAPQWWYYH
jgi:hypothetical protein